jgi:hypothetical protein
MSRDTDKSLFISSPLANKYAGLYQQLLSGFVSYKELGNRIIKTIKAAHAFRQVEHVRELSRVLINFPIKEYQLIGKYYLVWCQCRESKLNVGVLERIVDQSLTYKSKAFLSLAGFAELRGDFELELSFLNESLKAKPGISDYIQAIRATAIVKAIEGFHASSLKDMENLLPFIRHAEPLVYYDFLNSYAVELGEAGHRLEARNVIKHVLASPFAHAYPEWQETAKELSGVTRSHVLVPSIKHEHIEIEAPAKVLSIQAHQASEPEEPAKVLTFPELKEAPRPNKPNLVDSQEVEGMKQAERREFILAAIRSGAIPESEYKRMIYMLGLVKGGPASKVIDLEDKARLKHIIMLWCNLIEPEQFAAVMSALRDCKDDWRREAIMDDMITLAYQQTYANTESEREWREKFECRLPEK